jgi:hypothetical protein
MTPGETPNSPASCASVAPSRQKDFARWRQSGEIGAVGAISGICGICGRAVAMASGAVFSRRWAICGFPAFAPGVSWLGARHSTGAIFSCLDDDARLESRAPSHETVDVEAFRLELFIL